MKRSAALFLQDWLDSEDRRPLVLRGARQVGKTWLVRELARLNGKKLIELNFEKNPRFAPLFSSNNPEETLEKLGVALNATLDSQKTLLFLDEIQEAPELFAKLRWFAEDLPQLAVVAAGSLLEFLLQDHTFSVPVGRIDYMHLEPLSFEEFLQAREKTQLYEFILKYVFPKEIPDEIHHQLTVLFKEYLFIGGMPASVASWVKFRSLPKVSQIQHNILATYRDDFGKYGTRLPKERLDEVLMATPRLLGQKFVYSRVNSDAHPDTVKKAVKLLNQARVCHTVISSASNGVPLASETKDKFFKEIFLDTGLACSSLGLGFEHIQEIEDIILINSGAIAEQVAGQLLRTIEPFYVEPALFYWHRDEKNSSAELDYVIQHQNKVIPVEVKAGATGTMRSLSLFMNLKSLDVAVRVYSGKPNLSKGDFSLLSIPFYLCGQIHRLLKLDSA